MLKDKRLTYISLFSSAGVGCYGFKMENYECIATNEFIERRLNVQKCNNKCKFDTGYILGDIKQDSIKEKIFDEVNKWAEIGNDGVDVLIATPPCQGMSVANHKKNEKDEQRNSLVVESLVLTKKIKPKFFVFENVSSFLNTGCTLPNNDIVPIKDAINLYLSNDYLISSKVINFKNYGSNSSRTRTLVIGVNKSYEEFISPIDLFPNYRKEKTLREVIGNFKNLKWGEIDSTDKYHFFRTYDPKMECWISSIKEGESAFDNLEIEKRPHKIVDGAIVENVNKNGDKYTRQYWDKVAPCIHTRNDQLASQNTIHPVENRVFSIRELMKLMTIPDDFNWSEVDKNSIELKTYEERKDYLKKEEIKIRQSIGEAVPTEIFRQIAQQIKISLLSNNFKVKISEVIKKYDLNDTNNLLDFIKTNKLNYSFTLLSKIAEMANSKRTENDAYYTNKPLLNYIYDTLPTFSQNSINILEPSVGVGNFVPYIFKKYEDVPEVNLYVVDIDCNSLDIFKELLNKLKKPTNFKIHYVNKNFLDYKPNITFDLVIGNPPFTKVSNEALKNYKGFYNINTKNLSALFLEKAIKMGKNICMILPKYILNTKEFNKTRELLSKYNISYIYDFGEKGFKGVLIETICITLNTNTKPNKTIIRNIPFNLSRLTKQNLLTSSEFPYWILYRDEFFDKVCEKLDFDKFNVFRDRQLSNKVLTTNKTKTSIRVLKSRNICENSSIINIENYDAYVDYQNLINASVFKYFNKDNLYLVPNMTYKPRMLRMPKNITVNGSVAILIPKENIKLTDRQVEYFSSDEFRKFYQIARNYQTRSLNIDDTSVFFFGILKEVHNV